MKVNIPSLSGKKKYRHNLTHQVHTTSGFAFLQPVLVEELTPDDTVDYAVAQRVFLNPMVKPTFGEIKLKTYTRFVPMADLYHPFESMLTQKTYRGSDAHYIPYQVPSVNLAFLSDWLKSCSEVYFFQDNSSYQVFSTENGFTVYETGTTNPPASIVNVQPSTHLFELFYKSLSHEVDYTVGNNGYYLATPQWAPVNNDGFTTLDSFDWYNIVQDGSSTVLICGRYYGLGLNLRKNILGCGYQLNSQYMELSVMPLLAYYKCYFDMFIPQREMTWKDTYAFGFLERIEQHDLAAYRAWVADSQCRELFFNFLKYELGQTYYAMNPDFVSAHISGASLPIAGEEYTVPFTDPTGADSGKVVQGLTSERENAIVDASALSEVSWNALELLKSMYHMVNTATQVGGRVKDLLRSLWSSDYRDEKESFNLGSQTLDLQIEAVMNQAETAEAALGEYAARGVGNLGLDQAGHVHFTASGFGYIVSMCTFVATQKYCQAVSPTLNHLTRFQFYNWNFDSKTLLPTAKQNIYGIKEIKGTASEQDDYNLQYGFGNIPLYMEYKQHYNIHNGEMSLGSTRASYLPFTIDRLLPYRNVQSHGMHITNLSPDLIVNGELWRYQGKYSWIGMEQRIFQENPNIVRALSLDTDLDVNYLHLEQTRDNFILFNYVLFEKSSYQLPTADSFETGSLGQNSFSVQKA